MNFADRLKQLPSVAHLAGLQLSSSDGQVVATIENKPGQAGSLAVYAAMAQIHGGINRDAALAALNIYAEHTEDARLHPGKHPNIDRLLAIAAGSAPLTVTLLPA